MEQLREEEGVEILEEELEPADFTDDEEDEDLSEEHSHIVLKAVSSGAMRWGGVWGGEGRSEAGDTHEIVSGDSIWEGYGPERTRV